MYREKKFHNNDAVSPVVGVMLMLVVTIIIAALVSSFASGIAATNAPSPTTAFDISFRAGDAVNNYNSGTSNKPGASPEVVIMKMLAGELLSSKDLKIVTTYTVPETYNGRAVTNAGKVIQHTLDGSIGQVDSWKISDDPFTPQVHGYKLSNAALNSLAPGNGMLGGGTPHFGTTSIRAGEEFWFKDRNAFFGFDITDRLAYGFAEGSIVHITIIHTPSGQTIFDKDVIASW